ncbi:electron transfer flavoprotein subunit beta/FixA family protein [Marinomonas sp. IMCC 4694]|uniref:electron transfer flavoprotein subunit beta/FixA family protein n=1 Tax=Marinomonas sp. IMCC 4694 TaxID=2605432 RepID=UPI0011E6C143|nr:electron transfer flavoprotein subunit beta/FixA family protein [Marinomonas sp. IMCC 4694]TYL47490.1 electron transfer flavoprotein subunit beta/FixA family protein [Marinomonas sp. IMCC 4694]
MKILVGVKRVIDYNVKVRVKADESNVDLTNVKMAMNPFCEIAVEEAVRLKEAGVASEIIVMSVGGSQSQEQLRNALALGADRAILVSVEGEVEPLNVAKAFAAVMKKEHVGLVLLGKQSIDSDNNQMGQMLAALTQRPQGTFASKVVVSDDLALVTREIDGGLRTLALSLPAIVTTDLRLNEPRYAKLPDIMKAKRKPLDTMTLADLDVAEKKHTRVDKVASPITRSAGVKVASVDELIRKLKDDAKVI